MPELFVMTAQIISELVNTCRNHDFTDIMIVHEHRGEPDGLVVCHLPYGPTAFFGIYNTVSTVLMRVLPWPLCRFDHAIVSSQLSIPERCSVAQELADKGSSFRSSCYTAKCAGAAA